MAHHGNARLYDAADGVDDFNAAFQLYGICSCLLHDAYGIAYAIVCTYLIGAKGHVADHQCTVHASHHATCMINHLVYRDGKGGGVSCHYIAG